jgi:exopolysaccharide biosynthesis polyprenyl glycosylphosphotransferase
MTPPAASHVGRAESIRLPLARSELIAAGVGRLLDRRVWSQARLLLDAIVLSLAATAAFYAAPIPRWGGAGWLAAAFPALTLMILRARQDPDERLDATVLDTAAHVLGAASLSAMLMVATGSIIGGAHPVGLALRLWLFAAVYLSVARIVLASIRTQAQRNYALATPTLILGSGVVAERVVMRLTGDRGYGLRPVGLLDSDPQPTSGYGSASAIPVLGGPDDLAEAIRQTGARRLILAFSSEPDHVLLQKVRECERLGVDVSVVPRMFEAINDRAVLDHLGGLPLISLHPTDPHGWQFAVKHAVDRCIALGGLVALAPVLGAIALAVRLTSPGPALFRQRRVGRDGRAFDVLKFRTMREPDPGLLDDFIPPEGCAPGGVEGEDRTTPLGRFLRSTSLDEVPQLINVLRGEMSIVGPRPERPQFAARFGAEVNGYDDRLRVKSGITGWAQVNGLRGQTSIADRVEWDNYYIRNWSLGLDIKIMMLTFAEVLRLRDSQSARSHAGDPAGPRRRR